MENAQGYFYNKCGSFEVKFENIILSRIKNKKPKHIVFFYILISEYRDNSIFLDKIKNIFLFLMHSSLLIFTKK